jgi:integrase
LVGKPVLDHLSDHHRVVTQLRNGTIQLALESPLDAGRRGAIKAVTTGAYVASLKSAWETLLLLANGIKPTRAGGGKRVSNRKALAQVDLHWRDLRHEALSRLADDGLPVHELQLLAGHANITTTQCYMNARASSLAESMRKARERRVSRVKDAAEATAQIG